MQGFSVQGWLKPWGGGGGGGVQKTNVFLEKTIISHLMFSSRFMLFPTFLGGEVGGGGGGDQNKQNFVILVSEPVGTSLLCKQYASHHPPFSHNY